MRGYSFKVGAKLLLFWLTALVFAIAPFSAGVHAQTQPLRFLCNKNIAPYISLEDDKAVGIVADLAYAVADKAGLSIAIDAMDWSAAQSEVLQDKADALLQMNSETHRDQIYDFSDPILDSNFHIFRKTKRVDIQSLASLRSKKVGVESGGFPAEYLNGSGQYQLVPVPTWKAAFILLNTEQIDAVIVDRWVGEFELATNRFDGITILDPPVVQNYSRIAVKKGNKNLLNRINLGLGSIKEDGTYQRILDKWRSKEVVYFTKEALDRLKLFAIVACGAILIGTLIIFSRKQSEAALRESEARYRGLVEQISDGIFLASAEGRYIDVNPAGCGMLAMSRDELLASTFLDVLEPQEHERLPSAIAVFADGKVHYSEWHFRRKDGSIFIGELAGRQLPDGRFFGVLRDTTDRRRAEEHIRFLMRELNHRSKNMLALVQAVARQTVASNPNDFMTRFGERIQALAAAQDLLVKNEWNGVDFSELVHSQLAHFNDLMDTRISLCGQAIMISASAAQSLGMALHELATNAGKYGALSNDNGRVLIDWQVNKGANGDRFVLRWRETGGPTVEPPSRKGFGSIVIAKLIEANLKGKVDLDFPPSGMNWGIECDMSAMRDGN